MASVVDCPSDTKDLSLCLPPSPPPSLSPADEGVECEELEQQQDEDADYDPDALVTTQNPKLQTQNPKPQTLNARCWTARGSGTLGHRAKALALATDATAATAGYPNRSCACIASRPGGSSERRCARGKVGTAVGRMGFEYLETCGKKRKVKVKGVSTGQRDGGCKEMSCDVVVMLVARTWHSCHVGCKDMSSCTRLCHFV